MREYKDLTEEIRRNYEGAVLLCDKIKYYCSEDYCKQNKQPPLIDPFDEDLLKPASYHLRLGPKCRVNGEDKDLSDEKPTLEIPPHGMAVVSTYEKVNIPPFLIGRWNLKVKKVYKGLLWVGGAQVDPGYHGYLSAPLYNLSTEPVYLYYKEPLFTIDFVKTTFFDESKGCKVWKPNPDRPIDSPDSFKYLDSPPLKSGVRKDIDEMEKSLKVNEKKIDHFQSRIDIFQTITFTVLGIIVAALSFIGTSKFGGLSVQKPTWWQIFTWIIILTAIVVLAGFLVYAGTKAINVKVDNNNNKVNNNNKAFKIVIVIWLILLTIKLLLG